MQRVNTSFKLAVTLLCCVGHTSAIRADNLVVDHNLAQRMGGKTSTDLCPNAVLDPETVKSMIRTEAALQAVDVKLALSIAKHESSFGQRVNSKAGARGIMQLMPKTALHYGVSDICDAQQNIHGGIAYLKDLNRTFGGNVMLMIAAYNSGEPRVFKSGGIPAIAETVDYTAKVSNSYFGFDNQFNRSRDSGASISTMPKSGTSSAVKDTGVTLVRTIPAAPTANIPKSNNQNHSALKRQSNEWIGGSVLFVQ